MPRRKPDTPHVLFINPWIHDFAAYDFWAKPAGLLQLAAILRQHGYRISYIDCLDRFHPEAPSSDPATRNGRGPYLKKRIQKPPGLTDIPRHFSRYGIREVWLRKDLANLPAPDLILVTSMMTYWYTGVQDTIRVLRDVFPEAPILVGGVYATLCTDHANTVLGANRIISGAGESQILQITEELTGFSTAPRFDCNDMDTYPYPAYDLQHKTGYIPILTAKGCPFKCAYCASAFLNPRHMRRDPLAVTAEIKYWHRSKGIVDFAFYDDALLVKAETHALPMLEAIVRSGLKLRFHTPNALHIREISASVAKLMYRAGFKTVRLGLETARFENRSNLDEKVNNTDFHKALGHLKDAGFDRHQIGAYLLAGLPNQSMDELHRSIEIVQSAGISPIFAYYTPIPHTSLWPQAVAASRYDLEADPIYTNNAILPCSKEPFSWASLTDLKNRKQSAEA